MDIRTIKRLQKFREHINKTLNDLSSEMGLSASYLSSIFWGKANPNLDFFYQLGKLYNVSIDWILFGIGDMFLKDGEIPQELKKLNIERELVRDIVNSLLSDDVLFNEALLRKKLKK